MTDAHSLLLQFFIAKRVDKDDAVRSKYSQIINHYRGTAITSFCPPPPMSVTLPSLLTGNNNLSYAFSLLNHSMLFFPVEQEPDLEVFLSVINKNIRFLYLEIRRAFDEQTGELHWGLVNTRSDEDAQMATDYNQAEIDLLKRIVSTTPPPPPPQVKEPSASFLYL